MKRLILITPVVLLMLMTTVCAQQKENPFVGVWEPVPNQGMVHIKSLWIDEDGTFATEANSGHKDIKGTYTIKDGKLLLEAEEWKRRREDFSATITSDGRLKLTESDEENPNVWSLYFVKK